MNVKVWFVSVCSVVEIDKECWMVVLFEDFEYVYIVDELKF